MALLDHGPEGVAGSPSRQFPLKAPPGAGSCTQPRVWAACINGTPARSTDRGRVSWPDLVPPRSPISELGDCRIWNLVTAVPALRQKTLTVVPAPLIQVGVPSAPPALEMPNPTVEFTCGNCGAVLMRGDEGEVYPLIVHCTSCGSYNATDV
jgi:predicted RNA-binding Zn-ribbon protein involved in translation (DUF1610 family)